MGAYLIADIDVRIFKGARSLKRKIRKYLLRWISESTKINYYY